MRRIIALLLSVILCFNLMPTVFAAKELSQDFEEKEIGSTQVGFTLWENTETAYAQVEYDPLDETNKALHLVNDGKGDRYISTSGDFSDKTYIKFRFYRLSGPISMYLRDSLGTTNNIHIFSAAGSKISCMDISQEYDSSKWVTVQIVLDQRRDSISLYSDVATGYNGVLTLIGKGSISAKYNTKFENHTFNSTTLRTGSMSSSGDFYLDDFSITSDVSVDERVYIKGFSAQKEIMGKYDNVSALRDGKFRISAEVTGFSETPQSASMFFALYGSDGRMKQVSSSKEKVSISLGETKSVFADMDINSVEAGDYLKAFLFDGKDNIRPLAHAYELKSSETYYRPNTFEVLEAIYENHPTEYDHPRVVRTNEEFDTLRGYLETDSYFKSLFDRVKSATSVKPSLPSYTYDARNTILSESRKAMNGILPLAFLYQMSTTEADKIKYGDAVWRIASVVCDTEQFPDWNHYHHYLDTGEMGLAVAIAYDWCYDYWTDEQLKIMEDALYNNIIEISLGVFEGRYTYSGLKAGTNWNPVCNGGTIAAAAAIAHKYPEECAKVISCSTEAIEKCLHDYAPAGGYSESPTYWNYGTTYLMWCMSTLDSLCGTSYGIEKASGLSITGYFPAYATGPTGNWNYHDGGTGILDTSLSMFFADKYNDSNLAGMRVNFLKNKFYGTTVKPNFKDLLFYNPELINPDFDANDLDIDSCYKGIETVFMRGSFTDKSTIFTGLHGGYNSTNHGDLDAGTFILDAAGVRFIDELGSDAYTLPGYFGKGENGSSWKYYRKGTEGQSTIMIADDSTIKYGQNPKADIQIVDFESKESGSYAVADMTPALGSKVVDAKRGVMLGDYRRQVVVQDEITFNAPTELYWLAHTKGTITVDDSGKRAVITRSGKHMAAYLISDNPDLVFETMAAEPLLDVTSTAEGQNSRGSFKKLYIHADGVEEFNVAVVFRLIDSVEASSNYYYDYTDIANWTIPDDPMPANEPYLDMIYLDGEPIEGFSSDEYEYKCIIPYDADESAVGNITFDVPEGYIAEFVEGEISAQKRIEVYHKSLPGYRMTYIVYVSKAPEQVSDGNYTKYTAVSASATSEPEADHPASKAIDSDLSAESRWSADASGAALTIDLGEAKTVDAVSIAFYKGLARNYSFSIMYSSNGKVFSNFMTNLTSSGLTDGEEIFKFATPISARYIRFKGFGNTENAWNSVIEFAALYKNE